MQSLCSIFQARTIHVSLRRFSSTRRSFRGGNLHQRQHILSSTQSPALAMGAVVSLLGTAAYMCLPEKEPDNTRTLLEPSTEKQPFSRGGGNNGDAPLDDLCRRIERNDPDLLRVVRNKDPTIGDDGTVRIVNALRTNSVATTLDLSECGIGDRGAVAIAELLKINSNITWVRLAANRIGERGGVALAEALKDNNSVVELYLGSTSEVTRNAIGPNGAKAFADMLKRNSTLAVLGLGYNNIQDEGTMALAESLKKNRTLFFLRLAENNIGDRGASAIAETLKTKMCFLKLLGLFHNKISSAGAEQIADALKVNGTLEKLGIGRNPIGPAGTKALLEALEFNNTLLFIDHNCFEDAISDEQKEAFKKILGNSSGKRRERKIWNKLQFERGSYTDEDWMEWIKHVRHEDPPSMALDEQILAQFESRRPFDVFLVNTGAQKEEFLVPMRDRLQNHGFRCFLDWDLRDSHGSPTSQMQFALSTCRHAVVVISAEFLKKNDPCQELEYAFERMKWIEENCGWRSLKIILFNLTVDDYKKIRTTHRNSLPDLTSDTVLFEYKQDGKFDSWEHLCDEVKADLYTSDVDKGAIDMWMSFLRHKKDSDLEVPSASHLYSRTETPS